MNYLEQQLIIEECDKMLSGYNSLAASEIPADGWISTIRRAIKMSIRQLADRLQIKAPSLKQIEIREKNGGVTLKTLNDIADSLDMKFVYGFVPKQGTLQKMIENRAKTIATSLVSTIAVELDFDMDFQRNKRFQILTDEISQELGKTLPRYFWSNDPDDWHKGFLRKEIKNHLISFLRN